VAADRLGAVCGGLRNQAAERDDDRRAARGLPRCKVAKIVSVLDVEAISRGLNPYRDAAGFAAFLETLTDEQWLRVTQESNVRPASQQTRDEVISAYRQRAQGPHCHGLRDLTLARLQVLGGELQTLLDRATEAERAEPWFGYALITEREVMAEISLRARRAAS
jgi:hypothetical protein